LARKRFWIPKEDQNGTKGFVPKLSIAVNSLTSESGVYHHVCPRLREFLSRDPNERPVLRDFQSNLNKDNKGADELEDLLEKLAAVEQLLYAPPAPRKPKAAKAQQPALAASQLQPAAAGVSRLHYIFPSVCLCH
jgi:hypothetical protein